MGLIILIITGALLGWLATIALAIEDGRLILRNVVAGIFGSTVTGIFVSGTILLGAIRGSTFMWATLGAIGVLGVYNFVRQKALS